MEIWHAIIIIIILVIILAIILAIFGLIYVQIRKLWRGSKQQVSEYGGKPVPIDKINTMNGSYSDAIVVDYEQNSKGKVIKEKTVDIDINVRGLPTKVILYNGPKTTLEIV